MGDKRDQVTLVHALEKIEQTYGTFFTLRHSS